MIKKYQNTQWKETYLENLVNELNEQISELQKENELLRRKDKINQETIKAVRELEFEYFQRLEELRIAKEKCKAAILEAKNTKKEYSIKMSELINLLRINK